LPGEPGRLKVTTASGDIDGDGGIDMLHVFGAHTFSIWDAQGAMVIDSLNDFERVQDMDYPGRYNMGQTNNNPDDCSDDRGPEPEALAIGLGRSRTCAFIGNERQSNIMIYDASNPRAVRLASQGWNRNPTAANQTAEAGDLGPEGMVFIPANESPNGLPLLAVANQASGATTLWQVN
jgi:hypothetical protein